MEDRIPTTGQEGRVLITPEDGSAPYYATVEMADNPTNPGTPLNKENLLQDSTEVEIFGNAGNRTVDEALSGLMGKISLIMQNIATLTLTVKTAAGNPLPGIPISGLLDSDGNTVKTNSSGVATGYIPEGANTLSISGYADLADFSKSYVAVKGASYTDTWALTVRNFMRWTSSTKIKFSKNVGQLDVSVGSGGGGGGRNGRATNLLAAYTASAGGGGFSTIEEDVAFEADVLYPLIVGAGGAIERDGGVSSLLGVTAQSGKAGASVGVGEEIVAGGIGNGNGANGTGASDQRIVPGNPGGNGSTSVFSSFTETQPYGGGGGSGVASGDYYSGKANGGAGGSPGGGKGGDFQNHPNAYAPAANRGGGGGSGTYASNRYGDPLVGTASRGAAGVVAVRMHLITA